MYNNFFLNLINNNTLYFHNFLKLYISTLDLSDRIYINFTHSRYLLVYSCYQSGYQSAHLLAHLIPQDYRIR